MKSPWSVRTAWRLIVLLVGFWLLLGIASATFQGPSPRNWAAHLIMPGGVFMLVAAVAWRWRLIGAWLLIAVGLIVAVAYPLMLGRMSPASAIVLVLLTMAAVGAGVLLLDSDRTLVH